MADSGFKFQELVVFFFFCINGTVPFVAFYFFIILFYLFYFWLRWIFVAARGLSLVAVRGLLIAVASLVAEHGL